jgi:HWE histidine kinase
MATVRQSRGIRRGRALSGILSQLPWMIALDASLKATVKAEGIGALAFIPLTAAGELVGKFMAYYPAPHAFTDTDVNIAVTIARHFLSRLLALGEAHELLTTENWDRAFLGEVVGRAIKPFQSGEERFVIEGPAVWVPAQTSLTLTLCLHELATNAVKYGALSNGTGLVHVAWDQVGNGEQRSVRLTWHEAGGPPVIVPKRKGFGSLLIESSGDGESRLDLRPDDIAAR